MPRIPKQSYPDWVADVEKNGYHSYLNNRNFSSSALASDFYSVKNQRWCYAASPLEKKHFYYLEFTDDVARYYDQYPIDPEISQAVAKCLKLRHHSAGKEPAVVTLDTVIMPSDESQNYASSVKTQKEISKKNMNGDKKAQKKYLRLKEKLLIEKKSSEESGIPWFLTTDEDDFYILYNNLVWMYRGNFILRSEKLYLAGFVKAFDKILVSQNNPMPLKYIEDEVSRYLKLKSEKVKRIFALACWEKYISFNLYKTLTLQSSVDVNYFSINKEALF